VALDVTISAPARIFVRGRGLDAELGGRVRIGGTSANVLPSGRFDLIRGRLDLLGKRFDIDEGRVSLQGALVPDLYFVASTSTDGVSASVVVQGPANAPRVSFTSNPGLPEEEIVARLLFGRDLSTLSVLQAAQLASAIATLTGRGGEGPLSRLRSSFGLDDLDVQSSEDGSIGLRAGKYIARNLYTDVTLDDEGQTEIRLNLDVPPGVTLRGRLDSEGQTGIGVWFERDY
jgi:translocation and assembly module TamB